MDTILREIRQDCRRAMNGAISASMREYGLDYKLNFGLVIGQIKALASKYGPSAPLAEKLWQESTRELKILATLVYPIEEFSIERANQWVSTIPNQEVREQVCINLFQQLPFAHLLATDWAQNGADEIRISGYWLLTRLLITKKFKGTLTAHTLHKYIWEDIVAENIFLRNASLLILKHMVRQSKEEATNVLNQLLPYKGDSNKLKKEAYDAISFEIEFMYS